jgi:hypothetical protein
VVRVVLMSWNWGAPASDLAVRPWMWVGPGSTPGLSRVLMVSRTVPSGAKARAARLSMRQVSGSVPVVSTSTTTHPVLVLMAVSVPSGSDIAGGVLFIPPP